ncbi:MAG TPA: RluA family pseudouridine synthase [Rectinemataceae bacterium]|nr:RluA family pseudouridine synthase [Rectinemataceae bacterium]
MNPYEILFEDDDILVANKFAPLPVLKDKSGDEDLQALIKKDHPEGNAFLEAAHRIDRRTSGIVVFAKNASALRKLEEAFRDRDVHKTYVACLEKEPIPPEGLLKHMIVTDPKRNLSIARPIERSAGVNANSAVKGQNAVYAELSYKLLMKTERYFFVEAKPLTGRHHQIRAQFAAMGWSIKGDLKYGARRSSQSGRIMLHGWRIEFEHPRTGENLSFTAALPTDETLWNVFADFVASAERPAEPSIG